MPHNESIMMGDRQQICIRLQKNAFLPQTIDYNRLCPIRSEYVFVLRYHYYTTGKRDLQVLGFFVCAKDLFARFVILAFLTWNHPLLF